MMIKEICLIAIVAFGLILVIPGTNVEARDSPQQNSLGSHLQSTILPNHASNPTNIVNKLITAGIGFGAAAIVKFKEFKEHPCAVCGIPHP